MRRSEVWIRKQNSLIEIIEPIINIYMSCCCIYLTLRSVSFAETVWLEFSQYTLGSRWRRAAINRKSHREEGNEAEGFYGGIRKLRTKEEINIWKRLWPTETLEWSGYRCFLVIHRGCWGGAIFTCKEHQKMIGRPNSFYLFVF